MEGWGDEWVGGSTHTEGDGGERPGSLTGKAYCLMSQPMRAMFTKLLSQLGLPLICALRGLLRGSSG